MPPNPPSNSRLPRLAVWSGYGTAFHWLGERCDLEQKLCDLGINHTAESQSD